MVSGGETLSPGPISLERLETTGVLLKLHQAANVVRGRGCEHEQVLKLPQAVYGGGGGGGQREEERRV